MKTIRRGMGKGIGKGYRNLIGKDPFIHSASAKGVKQPQKLRPSLYGWKDVAPFSRSKRGKYAEKGERILPLKDGYEIRVHWENTSRGFRHVARLYKNGIRMNEATENYLNRTWESYEYETVLRKLLGQVGDKVLTEQEKADFLKRGRMAANEELDAQFKTTAMVAKLGDVFADTTKARNDWKERMLKAGIKGIEMPEDWDSLSEAEKEKRLNKVIEFAQDRPSMQR